MAAADSSSASVNPHAQYVEYTFQHSSFIEIVKNKLWDKYPISDGLYSDEVVNKKISDCCTRKIICRRGSTFQSFIEILSKNSGGLVNRTTFKSFSIDVSEWLNELATIYYGDRSSYQDLIKYLNRFSSRFNYFKIPIAEGDNESKLGFPNGIIIYIPESRAYRVGLFVQKKLLAPAERSYKRRRVSIQTLAAPAGTDTGVIPGRCDSKKARRKAADCAGKPLDEPNTARVFPVKSVAEINRDIIRDLLTLNTKHLLPMCRKVVNLGLEPFWVRGDGACLFNALAHILTSRGVPDCDAATLRRCAVTTMSENKAFYARQIDLKDGDFDDYLINIAKPGTWGDRACLIALSVYLKKMIALYHYTERGYDEVFDGRVDKSLKLTHKDILCVSVTDNHYYALYSKNSPTTGGLIQKLLIKDYPEDASAAPATALAARASSGAGSKPAAAAASSLDRA